MFSKTLVLFVLASSALSGFAATPVEEADCPTVSTRTVTVTGSAAEETGAALVATGGAKGKTGTSGSAAAAAAASKAAASKAAASKAAAAAAAKKTTAAKGSSAAASKAAAAAAAKKTTAAKGSSAASAAAAAASKAAASKSAAAAAASKSAAAKGSSSSSAAAAAASKAAAAKKAAGGAALATAGNSTATVSTATPNNKDLQNSLTLDPSQIATGFLNNGQAVQEAGQVPSLTSGNNFINFCATLPGVPITNGKQITTGSCNPAIIGTIVSVDNMPSAKFQFPANFATIQSNSPFTISMAINNLETGNFVNAQQNYYSAPQQLNAAGQIIGHSHVVIEAINGLTQATPTDPTKFAFFKGLNNAAVGGVLNADVVTGLPAGTYRMCSINSAANHQPAIVPVAQHGSLDDCTYFTAAANGAAIPAANAPKAAARRSVFSKDL